MIVCRLAGSDCCTLQGSRFYACLFIASILWNDIDGILYISATSRRQLLPPKPKLASARSRRKAHFGFPTPAQARRQVLIPRTTERYAPGPKSLPRGKETTYLTACLELREKEMTYWWRNRGRTWIGRGRNDLLGRRERRRTWT